VDLVNYNLNLSDFQCHLHIVILAVQKQPVLQTGTWYIILIYYLNH